MINMKWYIGIAVFALFVVCIIGYGLHEQNKAQLLWKNIDVYYCEHKQIPLTPEMIEYNCVRTCDKTLEETLKCISH